MNAARTQRTRPAGHVGGKWFTLFTIAWLVIWMVQLTPLQLLLPLQLDTPDSADGWISGVVSSGLVLGIGGLAGVIAGPLAGSLSDRSSGVRRRRRPWALTGTWVTAVCLVLTGLSEGALQVGAAWVGVCVGIAIVSAAFTAMIADQLPMAQRGAASSAVGSAQALGIVLGVGVVVLFELASFDSYLLLAGLMAIGGTATALLLPDPKGAEAGAPAAPTSFLEQFAALRDREFRLVLLGRLVVNIGNALGTALLLFFLMYGIGQDSASAEDNLLLLVVVYTVFVVGASVLTGIVSDRIGKRRGLTVAAALVQAVSGIVVVISPTFGMTMVAAALMGVGYGAFSTVGLALATDLLPTEKDHGRDLGVVNTVAQLGQLLGPVIGAGLVALTGDFRMVFACATLLSIIGAGITAFVREKA